MQIVPVIDLAAGIVVHAQRGQREHYAAIRSKLVDGAAPLDVARALLAAAGGRTLYVADLDALTGGRRQVPHLLGLADALPGVAWWIDAGWRDAADARAALRPLRDRGVEVRAVYGTESFARADDLAMCVQADPDAILSLDLRGGAPLGDPACWTDAARWPADVIVMTLDAVGARGGPDLATLRAIIAQAGPRRRIIGAGGLRDADDVTAAAAAGAAAWLVASALHDGRLGRIPPGTTVT